MSIAFHTKIVLLWILGASVGLLVTVAVVWMVNRPDDDTERGNGDVQLVGETEPFSISGDLSQRVRPGTLVPLDLTISNPHDTALTVTDLHVRVASVHAPNSSAALPCTVNDFTVEQVPSNFEATVDAAASSSLGELGIPAAGWPLVGMLDSPSNQDGCKGATMTLAYTASGRVES